MGEVRLLGGLQQTHSRQPNIDTLARRRTSRLVEAAAYSKQLYHTNVFGKRHLRP
jgi:hypothetical protein